MNQQHLIKPQGTAASPQSDLQDNWSEKMEIQLNSTYIDSDLTGWTAVMTETTIPDAALDSDGSNPAKSDGSDIRYSSDSAGFNQLPRDVRMFNQSISPSNAQADIAVKCDPTSGSDESIYIWWGNSNASEPNPSDANGRYNAYDSNHVAVYTFNELSGDLIDRTSNGNDGTLNGPTQGQSGNIGRAYDFDGSNDRIATGGGTSINGGPWMAGFWVKGNLGSRALSSASNQCLKFDQASNGNLGFTRAGSYDANFSNAPTPNNVWAYIVFVRKNSQTYAYIDGVLEGIDTRTIGLRGSTIGEFEWYDTDYFDGLMSQICLSTSGRSDAWIKADYNSIENEGNFYTVTQIE